MTVIMGHGEDKRYVARIKAVHALGRDLSEQEVANLYDLLYRKQGEDTLPMDQLNALKNDVVNSGDCASGTCYWGGWGSG
jgi:hypothetical protein